MSDDFSNQEISKKLDALKEQQDHIAEKQGAILKCLEGDETDHESAGLIGAVNKNTEIRNKIEETSLFDQVRENTNYRKLSRWIIGGAAIIILARVFIEAIKYL